MLAFIIKRIISFIIIFLITAPTLMFIEYQTSFPLSKFVMNKYYYWDDFNKEKINCSNYKIVNSHGFVVIQDQVIRRGLAYCLINKLEASQENKLAIVHSSGGLLRESLMISDYINNRKDLEVYVLRGCSSACVNIATAASTTKMCKGGFFGIHQASSGNNIESLEWYFKKMSNDIALSVLIENGIDEPFITKVFNETPNESLSILRQDKALKYSIVDEVIDCKRT